MYMCVRLEPARFLPWQHLKPYSTEDAPELKREGEQSSEEDRPPSGPPLTSN